MGRGRTICSLMRLPSSSMVRILKSIPMVVMKLGVHASSQNRRRRHDLPTPESPMRSICGNGAAEVPEGAGRGVRGVSTCGRAYPYEAA